MNSSACLETRQLFRPFCVHQLPADAAARLRSHLDACPGCWSAWNAYRWHRALDTDLGRALRDFLGEDFVPFHDSSKALAAAWDAAAPTTPRQRADFFRASTDYLYNSTIWTASGNRPPYLAQALPVLRRLRAAGVIDYGCGIGADTLGLLHAGFTVLACDYSSPSTDFLHWRAARDGVYVRTVEPGRLVPPHGADTLWIIDTLDHLPEPHTALGEVLAAVRIVITENLHHGRGHGNQRFHHRMTPDELCAFFAAYGFQSEPTVPATRHLTVWLRAGHDAEPVPRSAKAASSAAASELGARALRPARTARVPGRSPGSPSHETSTAFPTVAEEKRD
ncbi:methyltransferase domain-containing protein [Streptomyces nanhaiensis]|uniref:methyltransferase domain-containing protein n=1 Tax=Streptomyces nanhaiensis TaxID=679319 RepID=UPI00399CAF47